MTGASGWSSVPTPIGNLEDITLRVLTALREADVVACEDTRHTRVLLDRHGISARTVSYHEHNEASRASELVGRMRGGGDRGAGQRRWDAAGQRPGLPAGAGVRGGGDRRGGPARAERGTDRAGGVGAAGDHMALRGVPAAQAGRAGDIVPGCWRDACGVRVAAARRRVTGGAGGGGSRPGGRGLPRADQAARGDRARDGRCVGGALRRCKRHAARSSWWWAARPPRRWTWHRRSTRWRGWSTRARRRGRRRAWSPTSLASRPMRCTRRCSSASTATWRGQTPKRVRAGWLRVSAMFVSILRRSRVSGCGRHTVAGMSRLLLMFVLGAALAVLDVGAAAATQRWRMPVPGATVVGAFSFDRAAPYAGGQRRGVDVRGVPGARVVAACAGVVTYAGRVPGWGRGVSLRCGASSPPSWGWPRRRWPAARDCGRERCWAGLGHAVCCGWVLGGPECVRATWIRSACSAAASGPRRPSSRRAAGRRSGPGHRPGCWPHRCQARARSPPSRLSGPLIRWLPSRPVRRRCRGPRGLVSPSSPRPSEVAVRHGVAAAAERTGMALAQP